MTWECIDGFMVNKDTGEVGDMCFDITEMVQDHDLEHYSVTPPVPYVPRKYVEKMKEYNKWLKGREKFIELIKKFDKALKYVIETYSDSVHN